MDMNFTSIDIITIIDIFCCCLLVLAPRSHSSHFLS
jgi:hypothetical protein